MNNIKSILLEATEYTDGASLAKAILRGQITGVSKKFFNGEEPNTEALDKFLQTIKANFNKPLQNKVIVLLLNKAKSIDKLQYIDNQILDVTKSYFDNLNKDEVKDPSIKQWFDKFEEVDLTDPFNQKFENKLNKLFADSASMKSSNEYEVIYSTDEEGWEVVVPKTFAAAKYLASIKGMGKAFWCTAAHAANFKDYTKNNNKLYIIRNVDKKIFYQMDFGYQNKWADPSFQDFYNKPVDINEVLDNIPIKILNSIRNKHWIGIYDMLKRNLKKNGAKSEEKKAVEDWSYKAISSSKLLEIIKKYHIDISLEHLFNDFNTKNMLKSKSKLSDENTYFLIKGNNKKYLFIKQKDINNNLFTAAKRNKDEPGYNLLSFPLFLLKEDGTCSIVNRSDFIKENIPVGIKRLIFGKNELTSPKYKEYSVNNTKIYYIENAAALANITSNDEYIYIIKALSKNRNIFNTDKIKKNSMVNLSSNKSFPLLLAKKNNKVLVIPFNLNKNVSFISFYESRAFFKNAEDISIIKKFLADFDIEDFIKNKFPALYKNFAFEKASKDYKEYKKISEINTNYKKTKLFSSFNNSYEIVYAFFNELQAAKFYEDNKDKYKFNIKDNTLYISSVVKIVDNEVKAVDSLYFGILNNYNDEEVNELLKQDFSYAPKEYKINLENIHSKIEELETKKKSLTKIKKSIISNIKEK